MIKQPSLRSMAVVIPAKAGIQYLDPRLKACGDDISLDCFGNEQSASQ